MVSKNLKRVASMMLIAGSLLSSNATVFATEGNNPPAVEVVVGDGNSSIMTAGVFVVTASSGANIRTGPGTNNSIVAAVPKGTELGLWEPLPSYDSYGNAWYAISYNGLKRWIAASTGIAG